MNLRVRRVTGVSAIVAVGERRLGEVEVEVKLCVDSSGCGLAKLALAVLGVVGHVIQKHFM